MTPNLMNKYSQKRKKRSSFKLYIFGCCLAAVFCLLAGLTYILIWWPNLWIENIEVEREDIKEIHALIRPNNIPSIKSFQKAHYCFSKITEINSEIFSVYVLNR